MRHWRSFVAALAVAVVVTVLSLTWAPAAGGDADPQTIDSPTVVDDPGYVLGEPLEDDVDG